MGSDEETRQHYEDQITVLSSEVRELRRIRDMDLKVELTQAITKLAKATEHLERIAELLSGEKNVSTRGAVQPSTRNKVSTRRKTPGNDTREVPQVPKAPAVPGLPVSTAPE